MFVPYGPAAGHRPCVRRRRSFVPTLAAACLALVVLPPAGRAQAAAPLTLAAAERLALESEPGQESLVARASALADRAVAAGELPDPVLRLGLANFPLESGGFGTEAMTQAQVALRQEFPRGDTLALSTRRLELQAEELSQSVEVRRRDVLYAVREAWLAARYWQDALAVVDASRPLFADLITVTRSLYAVGRSDQQDVLRAELELSRVDDRLLEIREQQARARAELGEWIGDAAMRPLAGGDPLPDTPPPRAELDERLAAHPVLTAAATRVEALGAAAGLAREAFKPNWALEVAYGYRDGRLPDGSPRSDFVSLGVTVELPFFGRNRRSRELAAALAERRAAAADREQLSRRMQRRLAADYARWQSLSERIELYETAIVVQAEDRARAALSAYQSEAGDFADVMRGRIDRLNAELELVRLQSERSRSIAALASLGGFDQ